MGDPVRVVKGWQQASSRKTNETNPLRFEKLVSEIAEQNVQCVGNFSDDHQEGRPQRVFDGLNTVHVGGDSGWLLLPVIPGRFT